MAFILNIDTAQDTAGISLAEDGKLIGFRTNSTSRDHAAWIQQAIDNLLRDLKLDIKDIHAVGVNNGPGSYTGLRIGLSTAKGLCYALNIPLLTANSLEVMALDGAQKFQDADFENSIGSSTNFDSQSPGAEQKIKDSQILFCPMIDARRMEVFTAIYDAHLKEVVKPRSLILKPDSFETLLKRQKILFLGNGSVKFQQICQNPNAIFKYFPLNPAALSAITYRNFIGNNFAGLAYTEPFYLKEFFSVSDRTD